MKRSKFSAQSGVGGMSLRWKPRSAAVVAIVITTSTRKIAVSASVDGIGTRER